MPNCAQCGRDMMPEAAFCPSCGQRAGTRKCPYCAEEIKAAATVCRYCQRELSVPSVPPAGPTPGVAPPAVVSDAPSPLLPIPPMATPQPAASAPAWGPGSPTRTNIARAGLATMVVGAGLFFVDLGVPGFLLLLAGAALVLNRGSAVVALGGGLILALVALIPVLLVLDRVEARRKAATTAQAGKLRAAELARALPIAEKTLAESVAAGKWEEAAKAHDQLKALNAHHPALGSSWVKIEPEVEKIRAARSEEERRAKVAAGLAHGRKVVADRTLCDTPKAVGDAWNGLKLVKRGDAEWGAAVALAPRLEACRRSIELALSRGMQKIMIQQREQWVGNAERKMLDEGMNVEFSLAGANKDRLTVEWALMSKAAVHQITSGGSMAEGAFLANVQKAGFKRVTFSDGWKLAVYYDLEPPDEKSGGKTVLAGMGIRGPLTLR